jgi:hypothetical protein
MRKTFWSSFMERVKSDQQFQSPDTQRSVVLAEPHRECHSGKTAECFKKRKANEDNCFPKASIKRLLGYDMQTIFSAGLLQLQLWWMAFHPEVLSLVCPNSGEVERNLLNMTNNLFSACFEIIGLHSGGLLHVEAEASFTSVVADVRG